jgi:hypothetical protein
MVARLVEKVGPYSITVDQQGLYILLDDHAREVGAGPSLEAMRRLGKALAPQACNCQACVSATLIERLSTALAASRRQRDTLLTEIEMLLALFYEERSARGLPPSVLPINILRVQKIIEKIKREG